MPSVVDGVNLTAGVWLLLTTLYAIRELMRGRHHSINFLVPVHFLLCGIPLFLDEFLGTPYYRNMPGYIFPSMDDTTAIIYAFYVSAVPLVWYLFGRPRDLEIELGEGAFSRGVLSLSTLVYVVVMALPILATAFSPDPTIYLDYAENIRDDLESGLLKYQSLVSVLCLFSLLAIIGFLLRARKVSYVTFIFLSPFLFAVIWLNGKRWIVALSICSLLYVGMVRRYLVGRRLIIAAVAAILTMTVFSYNYQRIVRRHMVDSQVFDNLYENMRLDYNRDAVIKFTIHAELHPERGAILEYRGQSLLFNLLMFVPRTSMPDKPWPYAVYVTAAIYSRPADFIGWGVTTSWLEEPIANLGWAGMLVAPFSLALLCRIGDSTGDAITHALTILFGCLMLAVQFVAFAPLGFLWFLAIGVYWVSKLRGAAPVATIAAGAAHARPATPVWSLRG